MAAVAVTFARYFLEITRIPVSDAWIAAAALATLTIINCFGVRSGSNVQSAFMLLKIAAIAALVAAGALIASPAHTDPRPALHDRPLSMGLVAAFGAAMTPVFSPTEDGKPPAS